MIHFRTTDIALKNLPQEERKCAWNFQGKDILMDEKYYRSQKKISNKPKG